jgi:serine/threonine protein kinase
VSNAIPAPDSSPSEGGLHGGDALSAEQEAAFLDQPTDALPVSELAQASQRDRRGGGPLHAGERLNGYLIVGQLGEGGMARVYLAEAPDGSRVALKVLRLSEARRDPTLRDRFEREADVVSRIDHPNVVRLLDRGDVAELEVSYLALEHVPGFDLNTLLARCPARRFTVPETALVLSRCAQGLAAVHAAGVLHRDLKPSNVLITRRGQVKLIDFGIALGDDQTQRLTERDFVIGTLHYLAPEVLRDSDWSPAADVYALGCVTYRMLTGRLPFMARKLKDLLRSHLDDTPAPAHTVVDSIPSSLGDLVATMLAMDPDERPSAVAIHEALKSLGLTDATHRVAQEWAQGRVGSGEFKGSDLAPAPAPEETDDEATDHYAVTLASLTERSGKPVEAGQALGPYRVVRFLERGAMGEVYLCEGQGERCAVKVIAAELVDEEDLLLRFEREMAALISMAAHPGIVRVRAQGRTQTGRPWFAMDYVEGRTLRKALDSGLPLAEALDAVEQLAHTLAYAHAQGLVHRDLKPDNVLLAADGRCLLVDFGLTKAVGRYTQTLTRTGEILGTPSYMAPEQVDLELGGIGPWTDVYQLGCLLYRVLAERTPYVGGSPVEIYSKLVQGKPIPALRKLVPDIEPGLANICHTALARDPGDRYRDAGVLAEELSQELAPPPSDGLLRSLLALTVLSLLLAAVALGARQLRRDAPVEISYEQDVLQLRGLIEAGRFQEVVSACESLLASLPEGGEVPAELVVVVDLLAEARVQRVRHVFQAGDAAQARDLLERVQVSVPERPWILAAVGEHRAALEAAGGTDPAAVARLAAWADDHQSLAASLGALEPARSEALAWELAEFTGARPEPRGASSDDPWELMARGERHLAQGRPGLAALAFSRVRGDDGLVTARQFGLLRVAVARGDWAQAVGAYEQLTDAALHPLDRLRLSSWGSVLALVADALPANLAARVADWGREARRRAPGLPRTKLALRADAPEQPLGRLGVPLLVRARDAALREGPAAGLQALGSSSSGSFLQVERRWNGSGRAGPEGLLLARGAQLAAAAQRGRGARFGLEAERLLSVAVRLQPLSAAGWVGLAQARLARRDPESALEAARRAQELCADGRVSLFYVRALVSGLVAPALEADVARARGRPDPAAELRLASGWLRVLEACQELGGRTTDSDAQESVGLWAARCRLERARRLVAAGSETLLAPSDELRALLAGVTTDTEPALAGVDVAAILAARSQLGLALLDDDPRAIEAAEERLVEQALALDPARRERALAALALRASAWEGDPRGHAMAYLALAGDLPARAARAKQRALASGGGLHLERARELAGDDPCVLLAGELAKFSEAAVAAFGDDAGAFLALAQVLGEAPAWGGLLMAALRARPLAPDRVAGCLDGLDADAQPLACALALLSACWHPKAGPGLASQAAAAAAAAVVASDAPAAHLVRALALSRAGRGQGIAKPERAVLPEIQHALACAMAGSPSSPTPRQLALHVPGLRTDRLLDGLLADGFLDNAQALLQPLDGSESGKPELERALARLESTSSDHSSTDPLDRGGAARAAASVRLSAAPGDPSAEPDWSLLSGDDPALEQGLRVAYALRRAGDPEQAQRVVAAAAEALAHAIADTVPLPVPAPLPPTAGPLLASLRQRSWPARDALWRARYVAPTPQHVLVNLILAHELHAPAQEVSAFEAAAAFAPWGRLAAILAAPRAPRLQARAAVWLLEDDWVETRLALERVLAFAPEEAPELLTQVAYAELAPAARAMPHQDSVRAWRALATLAAQGAAGVPADGRHARALRALAVDAKLYEAAQAEAGSATRAELLGLAWDKARVGIRVEADLEHPLWGAWRRVRLLAALGRGGRLLEQAAARVQAYLEGLDPEHELEWRLAARGDPWLAAIEAQPTCLALVERLRD